MSLENFIRVENYKIRVVGSIYDPHFVGKDVCEILGFENHKKALLDNVRSDHKKELKTLIEEEIKGGFVPSEVGVLNTPTFLGPFDHENLSHNDGRLVVLSEPGLMSLLNGSRLHKNKEKILNAVNRWLYTFKYENNAGLMDIFSFIKRSPLAFDIGSKWFQDLWYPLSTSQGPQLGALTRA